MMSENCVNDLMSVESSLVSFLHRVNDAYIASHTIHDLVNDSDYQKLLIKNGKAAGLLLGNRHLLPGYWFTVFVAPYESFQRVLESLRVESEEREKQAAEFLQENNNNNDMTQEVKKAAEKFKVLAGIHSLQPLVENFQIEIDVIMGTINILDETSNSFQIKNL